MAIWQIMANDCGYEDAECDAADYAERLMQPRLEHWRCHRYRDNPPVCLPLIGATDLGSTRLALQWHAVGAHLTAAYKRADWADATEYDGDNDNDDGDDCGKR